MKSRSAKRKLAAVLVAVAAAAFAGAAAAQIFGRGRFMALDLGASRYASGEGLLPALAVFLAVLLLLVPLLWRTYARESRGAAFAPGLYHYYDSRKFGARRLHLRVEEDGTAILMIDAYRVVHLNVSGAAMVKLFLDDVPAAESRRRLAATFRVGRAQAGRDYRETLEKIDLLVNRGDICPVTYFGIDKIEAFQTPVSAPYRMDLALTYRCNLNCSHCYNQRRESPELSTDEWKKVIRILWDHGIPHLDFTGGEPTLRDDLVELVAFAEDLGAITGLLTNGVRLADEGYVRELKDAGLDYVQVTLESARPEVHRRMVGDDTFDLTVRGIRNAVAAGIHVLTNTTVTQANRQGLEEIVPFLKGLGVGSFAVNSIIKAGRSRHADRGALSEEELLPLLDLLRRRAEGAGMRFTWYTPTQYCRLNPVEHDLGIKQCTAGKYNLAVEPDGTLIPCQSFYRPLGSVLNDPFAKLYGHDFLVALRRRDWVMDKCRGCEWLPTCGGGCPLQVGEDSFCCPDRLSTP
ncbi:MAG: radical SAM protein [Candidatus Aminicenantes bacterium]|nr:radical SAM protein [Candidatus Aminicenantes bacterium]